MAHISTDTETPEDQLTEAEKHHLAIRFPNYRWPANQIPKGPYDFIYKDLHAYSGVTSAEDKEKLLDWCMNQFDFFVHERYLEHKAREQERYEKIDEVIDVSTNPFIIYRLFLTFYFS